MERRHLWRKEKGGGNGGGDECRPVGDELSSDEGWGGSHWRRQLGDLGTK